MRYCFLRIGFLATALTSPSSDPEGLKAAESFADLSIHRDSAYTVEKNGALIWQGEGWTEEGGLTQHSKNNT